MERDLFAGSIRACLLRSLLPISIIGILPSLSLSSLPLPTHPRLSPCTSTPFYIELMKGLPPDPYLTQPSTLRTQGIAIGRNRVLLSVVAALVLWREGNVILVGWGRIAVFDLLVTLTKGGFGELCYFFYRCCRGSDDCRGGINGRGGGRGGGGGGKQRRGP